MTENDRRRMKIAAKEIFQKIAVYSRENRKGNFTKAQDAFDESEKIKKKAEKETPGFTQWYYYERNA